MSTHLRPYVGLIVLVNVASSGGPVMRPAIVTKGDSNIDGCSVRAFPDPEDEGFPHPDAFASITYGTGYLQWSEVVVVT